MHSQKLSILIPAAGAGRRMRSYGPKSLVELNHGETVLSRQLSLLELEYPQADIIVVLGYEFDRVFKHVPRTVKVVENERFEETNVVRSLAMGMRIIDQVNSSVLIVYGDLVFNTEMIQEINHNHTKSAVVVDTNHQMRDDEIGVNIVRGKVKHFDYGLNPKWAQIAYLTGCELEIFTKFVFNREKERLFGYEAMNHVVSLGGKLTAIEQPGGKITEIDLSKDIEVARRIS